MFFNNLESFQKWNLIFLYNNINQISKSLDAIVISVMIPKVNNVKSFLKVLVLLKLLTGKYPQIIRAKKSEVKLKLRKGVPIGLKVTLYSKGALSFIEKLKWQVLSNVKDLPFNYTLLDRKKQNSISFVLKDPFVFKELHNFYFFFKDINCLKIVCVLKSEIKTNKEVFFKTRLLQLPF